MSSTRTSAVSEPSLNRMTAASPMPRPVSTRVVRSFGLGRPCRDGVGVEDGSPPPRGGGALGRGLSKRPVSRFMPRASSVTVSTVPSSRTTRASPLSASRTRLVTWKAGPRTSTFMRWSPSTMKTPASSKTRWDLK